MKGTESYWGKRALDFVDAIEASATGASVISQFEKMIGDLGFHAYIMAGIPAPGQTLAEMMVANGWPAEWFELYNRENLSAVDPVPRHCFNTLNPFEWKDVPPGDYTVAVWHEKLGDQTKQIHVEASGHAAADFSYR